MLSICALCIVYWCCCPIMICISHHSTFLILTAITTTPLSVNNTTTPFPVDISSTVTIAAAVIIVIIVLTAVGILATTLLLVKMYRSKTLTSSIQNENNYIEIELKPDLTENDAGNCNWHVMARDSLNPPIPPQYFDETDFQQLGFEHEELDYEDGELYRHPKRRSTNSTEPKLTKLIAVDFEDALDSNPIYDTTSVLGGGFMEENRLYDDRETCGAEGILNGEKSLLEPNPMYESAQSHARFMEENPLYDRRSCSIDSELSGEEPIYNEALNPAMFSWKGDQFYHEELNPMNFEQNQQDGSDTDLLPFEPVYDIPLLVVASAKPLLIETENICEERVLGIGQFGEVVLGETVGLSENDLKLGSSTDKNARILVAVKKLKDQADSSMKESFEKEIKFMSGLSDENIVRLLAVCDKEPKFIVIEYMENGDLYQFLNQHQLDTSSAELLENRLTVLNLLYISVQIASGMRYLASLKYVHRDLASRNCLVGKNLTVKISDFGMSRNLYESVYYRLRGRAVLPIRWMAMEGFYGRFSEKTDVWSFGITLWEIFTMGRFLPYEELDDQQVIDEAIRNKQRKLLPKSEACPEDVYQRVMLRCWEYKLEDRADFAELHNCLEEIHKHLEI